MLHFSQPKSLAVMFLLGAFLTGGAVGFAADRAISRKPSPELNAREEFARELSLSESQRLAIDSIFDWQKNRHREFILPIRPQLDANRDSARTLILQRLDPDQQARYQDRIARMRAQSDSSRKQQEGK